MDDDLIKSVTNLADKDGMITKMNFMVFAFSTHLCKEDPQELVIHYYIIRNANSEIIGHRRRIVLIFYHLVPFSNDFRKSNWRKKSKKVKNSILQQHQKSIKHHPREILMQEN